MGIQDLQRFIEAHVPSACVSVDLLKIARGVAVRQPRAPASRLRPPPAVQLCLVVDAEGCLDRLYGGYYSDWVCGGQWSRMVSYLSVLVQTAQQNNLELAVYMGGALELPRMTEWVGTQYATQADVALTLKHLANKQTPPPKVWWTPPSGLRSALRLALRHLKVQVLQSTDDHRHEVMAFCRDNNYHGLLAEDADYFVFGPPRYFSAKQLKLTYKGSLETKEYILNEVARGLDLQPTRFSLLAALLGNYILSEDDLADFYSSLAQGKGNPKPTADDTIRLVVGFVRSLPSVDNLDDVGARVFSAGDARISLLKRSVQHYRDGTRDAHETLVSGPRVGSAAGSVVGGRLGGDGDVLSVSSLTGLHGDSSDVPIAQQLANLKLLDDGNVRGSAPGSYNGNGTPSNGHLDLRVAGPQVNLEPPSLPSVAAEVMKTAAERHTKGLMMPWVYQILTQGEIKIGACMEEEFGRELPNAALFYRPIRERVYAVLFNLYHHSFLHNQDKEKPVGERHHVPIVQIREWVYSQNNPYSKPDMVTAKPLNWGVPTIQRLWFGNAEDEKKRRLRAFLTCMDADTPCIRNHVYVPQHLLILACVLRFMMTQTHSTGNGVVGGTGTSFLCKPELDAFIAQALSAQQVDSQQLQDLQLRAITPRGAQLAALFMQGCEHALLVNDACGAPVPWSVCCPWLYFDGKLFHSYLLKATQCRNVMQLCDDHIDMVAQLDLIRQAVLEGLQVQYSRPRLPTGPGMPAGAGPGGGGPGGPSAMRGGGGRAMPRGGGRLEIGGVVVGSWAGNAGAGRGRGGHPAMFPPGLAPHRPRHMAMRPPGVGGPGPAGYNSFARRPLLNKFKRPTVNSKVGFDSSTSVTPVGRGLTLESNRNGTSDTNDGWSD